MVAVEKLKRQSIHTLRTAIAAGWLPAKRDWLLMPK